MKEYKVGDTIYVKGKVKQLDKDGNIYCYQVDIADVGPLWVYNSDMVEKLPVTEPVKPVLPKDVADELEKAKNNILNFYGYLDSTLPLMNSFVFGHLSDRDARIKILSDAWYNGYTVEKPKLYNLILGTDPLGNINALTVDRDSHVLNVDFYAEPALLAFNKYQFTQEEIDKYNKSFWIKNLDLNDYKVEVSADED